MKNTTKSISKSKRNSNKVNDTFTEWKETVVKPHQMSEARVYAVESRLNETENKLLK